MRPQSEQPPCDATADAAIAAKAAMANMTRMNVLAKIARMALLHSTRGIVPRHAAGLFAISAQLNRNPVSRCIIGFLALALSNPRHSQVADRMSPGSRFQLPVPVAGSNRRFFG